MTRPSWSAGAATAENAPRPPDHYVNGGLRAESTAQLPSGGPSTGRGPLPRADATGRTQLASTMQIALSSREMYANWNFLSLAVSPRTSAGSIPPPISP